MGAGILLDILCVVMVVAFGIAAAKRGFVRTAIELVGWILILYIALHLSGPIATGIYNVCLRDSLSEKTLAVVSDSITGNTGDTAGNIWEGLPAYITSAAGLFGITKEGVALTIRSSVQSGAATVTEQVMQNIVSPIMISVIKWIVLSALFSIGMFAVRLVARWLGKIFNFSLIGVVNRSLGGLLGIFKGGLAVCLLCVFLLILISARPQGFGIITREFLDTSYVYKEFLNIDWFFL